MVTRWPRDWSARATSMMRRSAPPMPRSGWIIVMLGGCLGILFCGCLSFIACRGVESAFVMKFKTRGGIATSCDAVIINVNCNY